MKIRTSRLKRIRAQAKSKDAEGVLIQNDEPITEERIVDNFVDLREIEVNVKVSESCETITICSPKNDFEDTDERATGNRQDISKSSSDTTISRDVEAIAMQLIKYLRDFSENSKKHIREDVNPYFVIKSVLLKLTFVPGNRCSLTLYPNKLEFDNNDIQPDMQIVCVCRDAQRDDPRMPWLKYVDNFWTYLELLVIVLICGVLLF